MNPDIKSRDDLGPLYLGTWTNAPQAREMIVAEEMEFSNHSAETETISIKLVSTGIETNESF